MWDFIFNLGDKINRLSGQFDRQTWIFIFFGVLAVGMICMRGFGSRTKY